jgi:UDP-N-acetylglucosamine--N-acetylmuramyl-(pentapeptide) pyrophosphoryl-undecaprenol N-acetylglucosamine transferase
MRQAPSGGSTPIQARSGPVGSPDQGRRTSSHRGRSLRVLLGGGGTAGHIYPALSVLHAMSPRDGPQEFLLDRPPTVHFAHGPSRIDSEVLAHAGIARTRIAASPVRGVSPHRAVWGALRLAGAFAQASRLIGSFRPDVVLVTGGYVSAPVLVAARLRGIPSVVFLPDVVPGLAVRALAPFASRVAIGFEATRPHWTPAHGVVTGYPVRPEFLIADRKRGRETFGIPDDRQVLFATGGSSGARSLNLALLSALEPILHHADLIHLCGDLDEARLRDARNALPETLRRRYHLYRYLHKGMADAMAASDLVICRAGASTMAELPAIGRAAILIPGTFAGGHQAENASVLAGAGAAVIVPDSDLSGPQEGTLLGTILDLLSDTRRRSAMTEASRRLARPEAAANIVALLESIARR